MKTREKVQLPLTNERIPGSKVQVINSSGENLGVISKFDAIRIASEEGLELVLIADNGGQGVPVAKIVDLGKAVYAKKKKAAEAKKKQKLVKVKELKIRPKIGEHDLGTKIKQAVQFLNEGKRIKVTLMFRGREMAIRNEVGPDFFAKLENKLKDLGADNLVSEGESKLGQAWSRIYFLK